MVTDPKELQLLYKLLIAKTNEQEGKINELLDLLERAKYLLKELPSIPMDARYDKLAQKRANVLGEIEQTLENYNKN